MKVPSDRPKGSPSPKGVKTPNAPKRAAPKAKVGQEGKPAAGARKRGNKGLLSGKYRG